MGHQYSDYWGEKDEDVVRFYRHDRHLWRKIIQAIENKTPEVDQNK